MNGKQTNGALTVPENLQEIEAAAKKILEHFLSRSRHIAAHPSAHKTTKRTPV